MRRVDTDASAPLALQAAIEARHKGLRHLELQQLRGAKSYQKIPGGRFDVARGEGFAEHDERPDESAEQIAAELFGAARAHHAKVKGDERFRVVLYFVKKDGGIETREAKFSIVDDDSADGDDSPAVIEAMARRDMLAEIRDYVRQLHTRDNEKDQSFREQTTQTNNLIGTLATGVQKVFQTLTDTIPRLVDLRLEAIEDRAEAILEGAGMKPKASGEEGSQWKESIASLKELFAGPIGQAGLAKAFGMSPAEAAALLGFGTPSSSSTNPANTAPSSDLRVHLRDLGASLSSEQRAQLRAQLGDAFSSAMIRAGGAATIEAAVEAMVAGFDALRPEQFAVFDAVLDQRQQALLRLVFDALEKIADSED